VRELLNALERAAIVSDGRDQRRKAAERLGIGLRTPTN
jgi:hypothetical protein